jgi:hypothetical protein
MNVMEVVLENQVLNADSMEEVTSDANPFKKLVKKEQRLLARLQEEQEAEVRAHERFQRARARLKRRRKRLERIQDKLVYVQEKLAKLHITDQQPASIENELVIVPTTDPTTSVDSEEITIVQTEQETTTHTHFTYEPIEAIVESEPETTQEESSEGELYAQEQVTTTSINSIDVEPEAEVSDGAGISSETNNERKPTRPLRLGLAGSPAAELLSPNVQSAKEAWVAAESAMQNARNAAHGIAASITFLSQTDGLSSKFMEELVHKQADANKELLKAQDAARAAYERFVQAQRDTEPPASQPVDAPANTAEDDLEQKQEHVSLPPAEENGVDQTTKLHAVRLYKEW